MRSTSASASLKPERRSDIRSRKSGKTLGPDVRDHVRSRRFRYRSAPPEGDFASLYGHRDDAERLQGSVYVTESEDRAKLFEAIMALRTLPWFAHNVRDIRAFRIEQWSDFTPLIKGTR